jgi:hypothetical protein
MTKRIAGILFIFFAPQWPGPSWRTILARTYDRLAPARAGGLQLGRAARAAPAAATYETIVSTTVREATGNTTHRSQVQERVPTPLALERSRVRPADLEHRQKGLLWYSTYKVDFAAPTRSAIRPTRRRRLRSALSTRPSKRFTITSP